MQTITPDALGNLAVTNVKFPENGYLYVYVCNQSELDVYFDNLQIIHYTNPLTEINDYYPFGLLAKTSTSLGGMLQNYKYNGKELQKDLAFNVLDYGARQYDPVSRRWLQVDPLAEKYERFSPYNYVADNPIKFVDPDGRQIFFSLGNSTLTNFALSNSSKVTLPKSTVETGTKVSEVSSKTNEVSGKSSEVSTKPGETKPELGDVVKGLTKEETKNMQPKYAAKTEVAKDIPKFTKPVSPGELALENLSKVAGTGTAGWLLYDLIQKTIKLVKGPLEIPKEEKKKPTEVKPEKK